MNSISPFLKAEWRKLVMANYPVEPRALLPFLPAHTELDEWEGQTYVSLVGFMFRQVRVKGLPVPFHTTFPEVNLRFYVRHRHEGQWKRGVVFIREIVPLPAVTLLANSLFRERYITLAMRNYERKDVQRLEVGYSWKHRGKWNELAAVAKPIAVSLVEGSQEEYITEHFWGYGPVSKERAVEYQVKHPRWEIYGVEQYRVDCDFGGLYGPEFSELTNRVPESVFLAEGSAIAVYPKRKIHRAG